MQRIKKITAIILSILTLSGVCVFGSAFTAGAKGTGAGLAEWALNAYYSGWSYVYGGATPGAVDCSGLIYSYCGGERCGNPQLNTATQTGSVSNGIPNVHGLGLWRPGHVGVYVGNNMEVDARGDDYGVCYQAIGGYNNWTYWFKLAACSYVTNGWEKFNGDYYYYVNGEYIVNTSKTIDGTTYYFDSKGKSSKTPSKSSSSSNSSSSSSSSSSKPTVWKNGSTGEEVKKIQKRLTELGFYNGAIDGDFGDATEKAYRAFQKAAGVTVDGIAGSDRDVLYSSSAPTAQKATEETKPQETTSSTEEATQEATQQQEEDKKEYTSGDDGEEIIKIQQQLASLGYFDIEATGFFGEYTVQAIKNFQIENSLEATGIVDESTYEVLFSDNAIRNSVPSESQAEEIEASAQTAPVQMPATFTSVSQNTLASADTNTVEVARSVSATDVALQARNSTNKALAKSSDIIAASTTAAVKRTANVGLWLALVAIILGTVAFVFLIRDRKTSKYAKYTAKKKKRITKADLEARW